MNKLAHLKKNYIINKAAALNTLFRLAENLGYPFQGVILPSKAQVENEMALVCGFDSYNDLLALNDHDFLGGYVCYGCPNPKAKFKGFNFQGDESKEFALAMVEYIYAEKACDLIPVLNALNIIPVNQTITQALIKYDRINNIDAGIYTHPNFLLEYYKVALGFKTLDYIENNFVWVSSTDLFHGDQIDQHKGDMTFLKQFFVENQPELNRFEQWTHINYSDSLFTKYTIDNAVIEFMLKEFGRNLIADIKNQIEPELVSVIKTNLLNFKPNKRNNFFNHCVRYRFNVAQDGDNHLNGESFHEYFVANYALQFVDAVNHLLKEFDNENKAIQIDDLTMDMFGRITFKEGLFDSTKFMSRYARERMTGKYTYEGMLAKINSVIVENIKASDKADTRLNTLLIKYIETISKSLNTYYAEIDITKAA